MKKILDLWYIYSRVKNSLERKMLKYFFLLRKCPEFSESNSVVLLDLRGHNRSVYFLLSILKMNNNSIFVLSGNVNNIFVAKKIFGLKILLKKFFWKDVLKVPISKKSILITDKKEREHESDIFIDYNYYNKINDSKYFVLPYYLHPSFYYYKNEMLQQKKYAKRNIRIFFSGTCAQVYERMSFDMMNRFKSIQIIQDNYKGKIKYLKTKKDIVNVLAERQEIIFCVNEITLDTTVKHLLKARKYCEFLRKSDFFLALPGYSMPHSHNCIEAMACGTIPVLNYAEYFYPPLEDGVNCIIFNDDKNLIENITRVLNMNEKKIELMHKNVEVYYENYLSPEVVMYKLQKELTKNKVNLLVNDECESISLYLDAIEKNIFLA